MVRGASVIPGAAQFIERLVACGCKHLILTNNPLYTPGDLAHRLKMIGLDVPEARIFTSALATAQFLNWQKPKGKAFVIGESGLTSAIHGVGYIITDLHPDPSGPSEAGVVPACGAMAALIEKASGVSPFFIGKPNPLMMRMALNYLDSHSENTVMVGDRMDTDVIAGILTGMETILVLTGVTRQENIDHFPYQPTYIHESVETIIPCKS